MYKLSQNGVIRLSDNAHIPNAPGNRDWAEYQEWIHEGNTPEPQFSIEEIKQTKISETKQEASKRIGNLDGGLPLWKQMNFSARAIELVEKGNLSTQEQAELDHFKSVWGQVKSIREASNQIEAEITALNNPDQIDVENHQAWEN